MARSQSHCTTSLWPAAGRSVILHLNVMEVGAKGAMADPTLGPLVPT